MRRAQYRIRSERDGLRFGVHRDKTTGSGVSSLLVVTSGAGLGCGIGVVINEFSDALGTGNFVYEFVELHYDQ